jgi:hypothetical protein
MTEISQRFVKEVAEHELTIAHDDGLYRHLKFRHTGKCYSGYYWFDLVTVPGALFFQGEGDGFAFRCTEDMFELFRDSAYVGRPNVGYWAQKLAGPTGQQVMNYSPEKLKAWLADVVREATEDGRLPGLPAAVREEILEAEEFGWEDETAARALLERFRYYDPVDGETAAARHRRCPDFEFSDLWEVSFRDYDWWFLWALEAILWGIGKYDETRGGKSRWRPARPVETVELPDIFEAAQPRSVVTVELPGGGA